MALMSSPSDSETLRLFRAPDETTAEIDEHIKNHPISLNLRGKPEWTESRPHLKYPESSRKHSLTAGTLMGPGRFDVPPIVFCDEQKLVSLAHIGGDMCGHVGMIHGGLLSIMLDEGLARCAFNSLPSKIGFTANLNVNFRNPSPANSYLLLTAETIKAEGRKCWVKGRIELLEDDEKPGKLLVEAEALYVEPKYAKVSWFTFRASLLLIALDSRSLDLSIDQIDHFLRSTDAKDCELQYRSEFTETSPLATSGRSQPPGAKHEQ